MQRLAFVRVISQQTGLPPALIGEAFAPRVRHPDLHWPQARRTQTRAMTSDALGKDVGKAIVQSLHVTESIPGSGAQPPEG